MGGRQRSRLLPKAPKRSLFHSRYAPDLVDHDRMRRYRFTTRLGSEYGEAAP
jgi:hypothetical protein